MYVFIQGGGFNNNGNANYNGSDLIQAAKGQIVVVNFNYRVGPYGFLASKEIAENMRVSERTIHTHRQNINKKLNLKGANSLVRFAVENRSRF